METRMILSVSRRTDIPAYYSEWFMNRLKEGYVLYHNPMNHAQICRVELDPKLIDCIVFWTKDPVNMLDKLDQLDAWGYSYYFQFTLTPYGMNSYGKEIEANLRDKLLIMDTFKQLSDRLGPARVLWRYDPILINQNFTPDYHIEMFSQLCKELSDYTQRCTISFVDLYKKLNSKEKKAIIKEISKEQMHTLAGAFAELVKQYPIELFACCEAEDFSGEGIRSASCIDRELVEKLCGHKISVKKDGNQRPNCGCIKSVDIGAYNCCKNGCIYCYANHSEASIQKNCAKHRPNAPFLIQDE
jgi:hypothetical protein